MTDENKPSTVFKIIKTGLLIIIIMSFVIPIIYFTLTLPPILVLESINKTSLHIENIGEFYELKNLLLLIFMIALFSLLYLTVTIKLSEIRLKLIANYTAFIKEITLSKVIIKGVIISIILIILFIVITELYYDCSNWWIILSARLSSLQEPLNFRNIIIGIAGIVTLFFAGWRTHIADQNRILAKNRELNTRFDNAVTMLSQKLDDSTLPAHSEAISHLSNIAIDGSVNTQRCLDIICRYNEWMEEYLDDFISAENHSSYSSWLLKEDNRIANNIGGITLLHEKRSQEALRAISHILTDISINNPEQLHVLNFHNKMLCGISLNNIKLDNINLENACLVSANLNNTSLNKAKLNGINLRGAFLVHAKLQEASLEEAVLQKANLIRANLKEANLRYANLRGAFLDYANLEGSHLDEADLQKINMRHANLRGAFLDCATLEGGNLSNSNLQGASLESSIVVRVFWEHANLQGASLKGIILQATSLEGLNLQGVFLCNTNLEGAILINTQLQGATIDNVDLSHAILLDCNLYGAILKNITSENIIFNSISDIGYIKDRKERITWLEAICQHLKSGYTKFFKQQIKTAWQAIESLQEPNGLDIIRKNSIVTKDSQGMYDISKKNLANLQKILQKLVNEQGVSFLYSMKNALLSFSQRSKRHVDPVTKILKEDTPTDKNINLVNKLQALIDQLIDSNKK